MGNASAIGMLFFASHSSIRSDPVFLEILAVFCEILAVVRQHQQAAYDGLQSRMQWNQGP